MEKIILLIGVVMILLISGCSQGLTNNQIGDIYNSQLMECIASQEYQYWKDICQNTTDEYYLKNCFGEHFIKIKIKPL